jgi:hypothetical protein
MSLAEVLRAKSSEYEVLAGWHRERASLDTDQLGRLSGDARGGNRLAERG